MRETEEILFLVPYNPPTIIQKSRRMREGTSQGIELIGGKVVHCHFNLTFGGRKILRCIRAPRILQQDCFVYFNAVALVSTCSSGWEPNTFYAILWKMQSSKQPV